MPTAEAETRSPGATAMLAIAAQLMTRAMCEAHPAFELVCPEEPMRIDGSPMARMLY